MLFEYLIHTIPCPNTGAIKEPRQYIASQSAFNLNEIALGSDAIRRIVRLEFAATLNVCKRQYKICVIAQYLWQFKSRAEFEIVFERSAVARASERLDRPELAVNRCWATVREPCVQAKPNMLLRPRLPGNAH